MNPFYFTGNLGANPRRFDFFSNNYFYQPLNYMRFFHQQANARYLDELLMELQELNEIKVKYPGLLVHSHIILAAEFNRVWNILYNKQFDENILESAILDESNNVTLQEKIALSNEQIANYTGNANKLHHASLKQLENETNCQILIRGKGSLLDDRLETRLKNYAGWEHLSEPLHLLVRANDSTITLCAMKLANGVQHIKQYLNEEVNR
ncbi:hypothetical protein QQG55_17850 [Brugia pahangi]|uniref:KHP30-like phage protein n=1 Tax=Brugia pahangi TaxID=6280 RepID=A0A0N4T524_BRUPA|nr:unnamed protein product [Brugia pahangi]